VRYEDSLRRATQAAGSRGKVRLYAGFCATRHRAVAIIPLGLRSRAGSSHLPAASPSQVNGCLFGVAPRRDCPFHPLDRRLRAAERLVSVALILTSRWAGVTCYAALWSPDVPPATEAAGDCPADFAGWDCIRTYMPQCRLPEAKQRALRLAARRLPAPGDGLRRIARRVDVELIAQVVEGIRAAGIGGLVALRYGLQQIGSRGGVGHA